MNSRQKRYREEGNSGHYHEQQDENQYGQYMPQVRYNDLSPEAKLQKRRLERQEKKDRERTLSYFKSVQRVLEEQETERVADVVDGFFVELIRLLKADPTLHLLRNGVACRVIELALDNCLLLHRKSLLYVLLGHLFDVLASPTASYTLERLMSTLLHAVGALRGDVESFEAELADGGPGIHAGSSVPSTATLVTCVVEELSERAEKIIMHEVAARTMRSIILVLGGYSLHNVSPPEHAVKCVRQLEMLGSSLMQALESSFRDGRTQRDVDMWLAIAQTPTASFILQSLLRVSEFGTAIDRAVRQRLESIHDGAVSLLQHLMKDPMGCHIFQAYIKVPVPAAVRQACDLQVSRRGVTGTLPSATERRLHGLLHDTEGKGKTVDDAKTIAVELKQTCWDKAFKAVMETIEEFLSPNEEHVVQATYILQDLALFAPSELHLEDLWTRLLLPRLRFLLSSPRLVQALITLARKCAFSFDVSAFNNDADDAAESSGDALPCDIEQLIRSDTAQGVRYFSVSTEFQKSVATSLCLTIKQLCTKGAAQFLLVEGSLQEKGFELARYILHFRPSASSMFAHSLDKLCLKDVEALVYHAKGSVVLQQYLRATATLHSPLCAAEITRDATNVEKSVSLRFLRRIKSMLADLVGHTYAAFVVEVLYDVSSLEVKEELVKLLVPVYFNMRNKREKKHDDAERDITGMERNETAFGTAQKRDFIARKVMNKCCVELYVHRPEEWTKMARRQCQVRLLMHRMSTITS